MLDRIFSRVDFVGNWRVWFALSGVMLALGIGALAVNGLNFGIDFEGGAKFTAQGAGGASVQEVREALPQEYQGSAIIQQLGGENYEIRTPPIDTQEQTQIQQALQRELGAEVSVTTISPTFGLQIRDEALQAVAAALLIIVAFISFRFEFAFAIAALAALTHDILITLGVYALVGREFNLVTVVALLTVLGYSLYDTVIIFDRIRENAPALGYNRRRFDAMINTSIRQVVRRSLYTSMSTLIPITALLIFGEATLSDFAFALLVGIVAGTYSSIFIASPVLSLFKAWRDRRAKAAKASA
ncbi:protein translocase subunit SecF [Rubrobacter taiwanensis]|uniref:Protein-export membrane protein SecF n=1 Tax=Rubrobacter taiwanensis TaxID=185139 RepID=A0A4R1BHN0_9ACTN|nr:protein translocase subunit SecF [Rubrobacter taiwanensis]TCJ16704.1 protein translocase subunit SecF [Rubrobacter taiwanensis]